MRGGRGGEESYQSSSRAGRFFPNSLRKRLLSEALQHRQCVTLTRFPVPAPRPLKSPRRLVPSKPATARTPHAGSRIPRRNRRSSGIWRWSRSRRYRCWLRWADTIPYRRGRHLPCNTCRRVAHRHARAQKKIKNERAVYFIIETL